MPENRSRGIITRVVLLVSLVSLFTDVASEMLYPVMPVYLRSIGFSVLLIGILEGLAEATAGLSKGYFGNLSDHYNRRVPFIRIGYMLSAISKPLMAAFTYPLWIFFARTTDRLGKGVRTGARDALLSDESSPENKGKIFGFHRGMDTLGAAIGPLLALVFLYFYPANYKWLFIIAFFPGLVAILLTFSLRDKKKVTVAQKNNISFHSYFSYWKRSSSSYKKLAIGLLAFTLFNSSDVFLLLALKSRGMNDLQMIGFYIFYNLVYAIFSYPMGVLADRIGLKKVLITGLALFTVVYAGMAFADGFLIFGALFLAYGIYASATEGIAKALITNLADKKETATAIGLFSSMASVMALLASSVGGFIWYKFGPQAMFLFSAVGVAFVVGWLMMTNRKRLIL